MTRDPPAFDGFATPERWRTLRESPAIQAALDDDRAAFSAPSEIPAPIVGGVAFAALGFGVLAAELARSSKTSDPTGLSWGFHDDRSTILLLAGLGLFGTGMLGWGAVRAWRFRNSPVDRRIVVALSKRSTGDRYSPFRMTFAFEDGSTTEVRIDVDTFGYVLPGDVGVAHFRGGTYLGFCKIAG